MVPRASHPHQGGSVSAPLSPNCNICLSPPIHHHHNHHPHLLHHPHYRHHHHHHHPHLLHHPHYRRHHHHHHPHHLLDQVQHFYESCKSLDYIASNREKPLMKIVNNLGGWDVLRFCQLWDSFELIWDTMDTTLV